MTNKTLGQPERLKISCRKEVREKYKIIFYESKHWFFMGTLHTDRILC